MATTPKRPRWNLSDLMGRVSAVIPAKNSARATPPAHASAPAPVVLSVREERSDEVDASALVPRSLRVAAALSWRMLVIIGLVAACMWVGAHLTLVIMPVAIALTLAVLLEPLVSWMRRKLHLPSSLAATVGLLIFFAVVAGALSQAAAELIQQVPQLATQAVQGFAALLNALAHNDYLTNGPLKLDTAVLNNMLEALRTELVTWLDTNKETLATGAINITSSVGTLATSGLTMLFCLFFFLKDGRDIWVWFVRLLPKGAREPVHEAAIRGWASMGGYVVGQMQVAFIDALSIGIGAYFLGVPLVIPIIVLVFFGSFIPIIGSLISGIIAVLVAVVDQGFTVGLIMLVIILLVQQVEGNLLQPLLMSNAVSLHPLVVLLGVTAGSMVAGIAGAIFSIPIAAFINSTVLYLHGHDPEPALATKLDRPGGAPGTLDALIAHSYGEDLPLLAGEAVDAHTYAVNEELSERMVTAGTAEPGDSVGTRVADEIEQSAETDEEDSEA